MYDNNDSAWKTFWLVLFVAFITCWSFKLTFKIIGWLIQVLFRVGAAFYNFLHKIAEK